MIRHSVQAAAAVLVGLCALAFVAVTPASVEASGCTSCTATFDCYAGLGRTKGFWSNPNGKKQLAPHDTAWRDRLNGLCLVNAAGNAYDVPAGNFNNAHSSFRSWILGPVHGNMAYILSQQLAAAVLNVEFGFMDHLPNHWVEFNGCKVNIQDLFDDANDLLCAHPLTTSPSAARDAQEELKDLFDALNNNDIQVCVKTGQPPQLTTTILVTKFYDLNLNGVWDNGEVTIPNWPIELRASDGTTVLASGVTDANGEFSVVVNRDSTSYVVVELMNEPYINITPTSELVTADTDMVVVDFGNVAIQCHLLLGRTRGFWGSSPQSIPMYDAAFPAWAEALNDLCLVDNNGTPLVLSETDPVAARNDARAWFTAIGPEDNKAHQLSVQLAVTVLNVTAGLMSTAPGVFVDWDNQRRNIEEVFAIANTLLCANPVVLGGGAIADQMEELKDFFDNINNNITDDTHVYLVLPGPVPFGTLTCVSPLPPATE